MRNHLKKSQNDVPIGQKLSMAVMYHRDGRLDDAWKIYQQILRVQPQQPDALRLSGVIEYQKGHHKSAAALLGRALEQQPENPETLNNLGLVQQALGDYEVATASYGKALLLRPDYADAYNNLGLLCQEKGQREAALDNFRMALEINPDFAQAHCNLGRIHQGCGDFKAASASYKHALRVNPNYVQAHVYLGSVLHQLGDAGAAESHYRQAVTLTPNLPEVHNNLGLLEQARGELQKAAESYQKALEIFPGFAEARYNLATVEASQDALESAKTHLQQVITCKPEYSEAHNNLGVIFQRQGDLDGAARSYQAALILRPDYAEAQENLATVFMAQGCLAEAVNCHRNVLKLNPDYVEAHYNLGVALEAQGHLNEAAASYRNALALNPEYAPAYHSLGLIFQEQGMLDQAIVCYQRAVSINANYAQAHYSLGRLQHLLGQQEEALRLLDRAIELSPRWMVPCRARVFIDDKVTDDFLFRLEGFLNRLDSLPQTERSELYFSLGRIYQARKDYERSFHYYSLGAQVLRTLKPYNESAYLAAFKRVRGYHDTWRTQYLLGARDQSVVPIFILGMPRSGTTLVEQILASHPMVSPGGELEYLHNVLASVGVCFADFARGLVGHPSTGEINSVGCEIPEAVALEYLEKLAAHRIAGAGQYVTDKLPSNFIYLGMIHGLIQKKKIIHCRRDPVDTCLSIFFTPFVKGHEWSNKLEELGRYYRNYAAMMDYWRTVLPPGSFYEVDYELLVANQENETRRLLDYCDLPWDERCLQFEKTERIVATASAAQVRKPMYGTSVKRWKPYAKYLRPLFEALGDLAPEGWEKEGQ